MKRMRNENGVYTSEALDVGHQADCLVKQAFGILVDAGYDVEDATNYLVQSISGQHAVRRLSQQIKHRNKNK